MVCLIGWTGFASRTQAAEPSPPLYANTFEQAALDQLPEDLFVLDGAFTVKEQDGNKYLELPGAPLSTYGALFGPKAKDNLTVSARIWTTGKGRKFSTFGVGLNGAGGFRLQVSPAKKQVELYQGDALLTSVAHAWESGVWTRFKLQVRKVKESQWTVEGKVWTEGEAEPKTWMIVHELGTEPYAGQASIWGNPFSGTPIRFDDLKVLALAP